MLNPIYFLYQSLVSFPTSVQIGNSFLGLKANLLLTVMVGKEAFYCFGIKSLMSQFSLTLLVILMHLSVEMVSLGVSQISMGILDQRNANSLESCCVGSRSWAVTQDLGLSEAIGTRPF